MSYSKRAHTFRTTDGIAPAARARLGSPSFVSFDVASVVPSGLVRKLATECRPTRVEHGFSHPRLRQLGRLHIADDDQFVLASNPCGLFVKVVAARVGDLGVDCLDAGRIVGALRYRQRRLVLPIVLQRGNLGPIRASRKRFQAEVNSDFAVASRKVALDLTLKGDVPAPARILSEATGLDSAAKLARLPEQKPPLEIGDGVPGDLDGARNKRNPPKRPLRAAAGAEPQVAFLGVAGDGELAADRGHGVGVQAKVFGDASAQLDQIETGRPFGDAPGLPTLFGLALNLAAIVPDLIARPCVVHEMLSRPAILDAIFKRQHHANYRNWPEAQMQDFRTGRHCVFSLHVHLVFVTKYRRDVLSALAIADLARIFAKVCEGFEAELVECNGEDDHVHLLVHYPPKVSLSKLVNSLKGVSSRRLREDRPEVSGRYRQGVLWSPSYFAASCGGAPLSVISQYVRSQREALTRPAIPPRPDGRGGIADAARRALAMTAKRSIFEE